MAYFNLCLKLFQKLKTLKEAYNRTSYQSFKLLNTHRLFNDKKDTGSEYLNSDDPEYNLEHASNN